MFVCAFWALTLLSTVRTNNKDKTVLGIFMIVGFVFYFCNTLFYQKGYQLYPFLDPIGTFAALAICPAYYIYIRFLTISPYCNKNKMWIFIPSVIISANTAIIYMLMSPAETNAYIHLILYKENGNFNFSILGQLLLINCRLRRIVYVIQIIAVLYHSKKLVENYNKRVSEFYSNTEGKSINWSKELLYAFIICIAFSIFFNCLGKIFFIKNYWLISYGIAFGLLTYIIGLMGFNQSYTIENLEKEKIAEIEDNVIKTSTCSEECKESLKKNLIILLEKNEIYKQQDLRITDISNRLNSNRTYISQIINNEFNCSFSDFINKYRIAYAKKLMGNPKYRHYNMNYFAEQSGFASLNSFLRAFKKEEGITPNTFKEKVNE
jgi:AraC-like DNA-binding protein